ncbi:MAG: YgaP family membrane protein [Spirochaetota bacterium]
MIQNMGVIDRAVRTVLAAAVVILYFAGQISGAAAVVLGIIAAVFIITSAIGFCPLYVVFKISTKKK